MIQLTTYTYDDSDNRLKIAQAVGCGYPVNMIYDSGAARVVPMEPNADELTVIVPKPTDQTSN